MMEWKLPVNKLLKEDITKLSGTLVPPGFQGGVQSLRAIQESLGKVIDALGEQSAIAQGLNKVITTAEKLHVASDHILYLLKDSHSEGGLGEVIGMLKVGRKRLFLFDEHEKPWEVEPLCVLDFFVVPERQRHGYGKILFDYMLQDMQCLAQELAIDGPSPNMERFLLKNYGFERLLRQNNNFAVSPAFFSNADDCSKSGRSTPATSTPAIGRFAATKPPSTISSVIHGGGGGGYYHDGSNRSSRSSTPVFEHSAGLSIGAAEPGAPGRALTRTPERPNTLHVEPAAEYGAAPAHSPAGPARSPTAAGFSRRDSQLTDRGFFDVKFYHNKLW